MAEDSQYVAWCDALIRLPGKSPGADREVEWAEELNKPVFHTWADLLEWLMS